MNKVKKITVSEQSITPVSFGTDNEGVYFIGNKTVVEYEDGTTFEGNLYGGAYYKKVIQVLQNEDNKNPYNKTSTFFKMIDVDDKTVG
jgi:hypothetical protein